MKNLIPLLFLFHFSLILLPSSAAVPMKWTVDVSRVQPEVRDVVRGETVALEATLQCDGKPFATGPEPVCIFWQTNGMGSAWWSAPASVTNHPITQSSNQSILSATFTPEMDPGAPTVNGFLGSSGSMYRAIFTLRFRHGPGAVPNLIEQPPRVLDLARTVVVNPPWPTQADFSATTAVMRAELKGYVDSQIGDAGVVSPQIATNIASGVASNVVTRAYVEALGISAGLKTNDVSSIVDDSLGGTNAVKAAVAAVTSLQSSVSSLSSLKRDLLDLDAWHMGYSADGPWNWTSPSSELQNILNSYNVKPIWEDGYWSCRDVGVYEMTSESAGDEDDAEVTIVFTRTDDYDEIEATARRDRVPVQSGTITVLEEGWGEGLAKVDRDGSITVAENYVDYLDPEAVEYLIDERVQDLPTKSYITSAVKVKSVNGETGDVEITPSSIGAAEASDVSALNVGYDRLYRFNTGATNANFTATNYPPTKAEADARCHWRPDPDTDFSDVPSSLQLNEFRDGELRVVFDSRDWPYWYFRNKEKTLTNEIARLKAENAALSNELENARAWAGRTANGVENPMDDTVVVDRPNLWLMAGYDWAKVVSGSNQCFVIRANNVAMSGGASTNGFLEVLDAFGKPYIRINKTAETFADPVFEEIRFDSDEGAWYVVFGNKEKPTKGGANVVIRGSSDGTGGAILHGEDEDSCPAVITWPDVPESHANHWIMKAVPKPVNGEIPSAMFFGAEIRVPGRDYVEYLKEASFGAGIRFGANVYDPVESGDQLIWRKRQ